MVCIHHNIRDAKQRKPDARAVSVMYNATCRHNKRHDIIAAAREGCHMAHYMGDGSRLILRQRVLGSVTASRAVRNTHVFMTETRFVADDINLKKDLVL
jgi:hypothetical protein